MAAPLFSSTDYVGALQALMPRGRVWPREPDALQTKVLAGLAKSYERHNERANSLLVDAFPTSTIELLPEWEASLGLPLAAAGPNPSIAARQTLVVARLIGAWGISVPDLQQYARLLGYEVTVTQHAPFRCGQSRCGDGLGAVEQMFWLSVTATSTTLMPFGGYGPAVLQAELTRVAPPYCVLSFNFT